jgi:hypothetical protein
MAVRNDDGFEVTKDGQHQRHRCTPRGWKKLLITWNDGSTSWVPLKDLKDRCKRNTPW